MQVATSQAHARAPSKGALLGFLPPSHALEICSLPSGYDSLHDVWGEMLLLHHMQFASNLWIVWPRSFSISYKHTEFGVRKQLKCSLALLKVIA